MAETYSALRELVQRLLANKELGEARRLIEERLSKVPNGARRRRAALLDILLQAETCSNRPAAALAVLTRRRPLGFQSSWEEFDAALLAARLLMKTQQCFAARAELTELLNKPKLRSWPGILEALAAYVEADEQCRNIMTAALAGHFQVAIAKFGIPVQVTGRDRNVRRSIGRAHSLFLAASRRHQRLLLKALAATTRETRDAAAKELEEQVQSETIGYFRDLAKKLLQQLCPKVE